MADFLGLMKQAAELKSKMETMQAQLDLIKPSEKEIVEDLIVAAHADARRKAEALLQEKMKDVTGGLPLPPGMKLF
jgi:DNA-binding protein YbaB